MRKGFEPCSSRIHTFVGKPAVKDARRDATSNIVQDANIDTRTIPAPLRRKEERNVTGSTDPAFHSAHV